VPPLAPGALPPVASAGAAGPGAPDLAGEFHLTGIIFGPSAFAILNDATRSYIVEPGDVVASGVRVVAIDAENQSVTLASDGQSWQLRLAGLRGGTSR
jgi:hypothetical protein